MELEFRRWLVAMILVAAEQALHIFEIALEQQALVPDDPRPPQSLVAWLHVVRPVSCVADSSKRQIRVKSRQG